MIDLRCGDCLEIMRGFESESMDAIITDPPYGLSFMGKKWDYDVPKQEIWVECLRVIKPGGHLLAFAGTRTQHRMACRIEDAGFEIRDMIAWVYGSGFPKSLNIGKAVKVTTEWEGWGTALKPALEPITVARKPLSENTVVENVLRWGTGGLNIDECRVETIDDRTRIQTSNTPKFSGKYNNGKDYCIPIGFITGKHTQGRFPANLIHDGSDDVVNLFPYSTSGESSGFKSNQSGFIKSNKPIYNQAYPKSAGSAARFFYCAKASPSERNQSLSKNPHPTVKPIALMEYLIKLVTPANAVILDPFMGSGTTVIAAKNLKRRFLGIEIDKGYFEIAYQRIHEEPSPTATEEEVTDFLLKREPKQGKLF